MNFRLSNSPLVDHTVLARNGSAVMTNQNTYDFLNRLTRRLSAVASGGGGSALDFNYQHNSAGQRTRVTQLADGSYWVYGYDALGQLTGANKFFWDGTPVSGQQFGYAFDTIGNRTLALAGGDPAGANLRTNSYTNNSLNQIFTRGVPGYVDVMGWALAANTVSVNGSSAYRKWEYFRQQLAVSNTSAALWTNVTVTSGQATNSGSIFVPQNPETNLYDLDGNETSDGRFTYVWDAENRLVNLTSLTTAPAASKCKLDFTYDYMGRRIQKVVSTASGTNTNCFVYDGWNVVAILDGANNLLYSFTWGTDLSGSIQGAGGVGGLLSMTVILGTNAGTYFYCYDGNGNVAALVNAANGSVAANWEYGPFGEVIRATGPMAKVNPFMFQTEFYDWETGKYYVKNRFYDPGTGRFLNRDPMEEKGGLNLYGFVANDGVNHVDPFGLEKWKDVLAYIKQRDKQASTHPCCDAQGKGLPLGSLVPTLTATASGMTVTGTATYKVTGRGPVRVLDYVWWNCFDADFEGSYTWGFHRHLYSDWQDYGWNFGDATKSEAQQGATLPPNQDHFDAGHWDWKVCIIYLYCDKGFFHVDYQTSSPQVEFDWNQPTKSWTNPHSPTGP